MGGNLSSDGGLVLVREFLDLDSTHSDTYGNQEEAAYNGHYRTTGYHPLVAFDGLTGDFLKAELRPGNVYTSTGVQEFLEPLCDPPEGEPEPDATGGGVRPLRGLSSLAGAGDPLPFRLLTGC